MPMVDLKINDTGTSKNFYLYNIKFYLCTCMTLSLHDHSKFDTLIPNTPIPTILMSINLKNVNFSKKKEVNMTNNSWG